MCVCLEEEGLEEKDVNISRDIERWIYIWTYISTFPSWLVVNLSIRNIFN